MNRVMLYLYIVGLLTACNSNRPQVVVVTSTPQLVIPSTQVTNQIDSIPPTTTPVPITQTVLDQIADEQYIVQAGDSLSIIAESYNVSIQTLIAINNIENPDLLEVGQIIKIPAPPSNFTPSLNLIPNSRLVRTNSSTGFDLESFLSQYNGYINIASDIVSTRLADGSERRDVLSGNLILERVSIEYSIDIRILIAFLEYRSSWITQNQISDESKTYPLISIENSNGFDRSGLYKQLSWLANELNRGYYRWKYQGDEILSFSDGQRLIYEPSLSAGTIALQYTLSLNRFSENWQNDVTEDGFISTYQRLFGNPFDDAFNLIPENLTQPDLTLPFVSGDVWLFTGGFHGGWGSGSAWSALDFAPPDKPEDVLSSCYTSKYPVTAISSGTIARNTNGALVLDIDGDSNESTGWTILYLHVSVDPSLNVGDALQVGDFIGYASCYGGFSTATHLHIARRYNGEWIPADCSTCTKLQNVPPFVMSNWRAVGFQRQEYQGYMINDVESKQAVAEQSRGTKINEISW